MLFEDEIDSCDDFIIDSSLLEKIHIKAKLPKEWITEYEEQLNGTSRDIFRGNSLESVIKRDMIHIRRLHKLFTLVKKNRYSPSEFLRIISCSSLEIKIGILLGVFDALIFLNGLDETYSQFSAVENAALSVL